jgi:hypothetical protein
MMGLTNIKIVVPVMKKIVHTSVVVIMMGLTNITIVVPVIWAEGGPPFTSDSAFSRSVSPLSH